MAQLREPLVAGKLTRYADSLLRYGECDLHRERLCSAVLRWMDAVAEYRTHSHRLFDVVSGVNEDNGLSVPNRRH